MRFWLGAALTAAAMGTAATAQTAPPDQAQVDDIVVTGRRSGVPLWTVRSDTTTLVLVGSIEGVSKTTSWDPTALTAALRKADRVVFPQSRLLTASPFSLIGWLAKFNAMGSLPKGQSLGQYASAQDMRRLAALAARKRVRSDYEQRHPLHLAGDLRSRAKGGIDYARGADDYVRKAIKEYKLELVPVPEEKAKPIVKDLFASTPGEHVACLHDAIAMAEAGPEAVQARSDAWAARRVPDVLGSAADGAQDRCWPEPPVRSRPEGLIAQMKQLLGEPKVTVAVLNLRVLAEKDGILDALAAAGFDIEGPRWRS